MQELIIVIISLFAIVDPLASVPVFMAVCGKMKPKDQHSAALDASLAAFVILIVFSIGGAFILSAMGISLPAFMIAGGILLLMISFDFIHGDKPKSRSIEIEPLDTIVPIGTPLLAGPGAITTSIYFNNLYGPATTLPAIIAVVAATFLFLRFSSPISKIIGKNGLKVFSRVMGILTAAVGITLIEKALVAYGVLKPILPI